MATKKKSKPAASVKSAAPSSDPPRSFNVGPGEGYIPPANGTAIQPATAVPHTQINLEFGIDNLVAIGVVHVENTLTPKLEHEVAEANRLGTEIAAKNVELNKIYSDEQPDPEFIKKCEAFLEIAAQLNIRMSYAISKQNFSPEKMTYYTTIRFSGDMTTTRECKIDSERAEELRDDIDELRKQQQAAAKAATLTKAQLNPAWLQKQLRAAIALNAMNSTETGADTVAALLKSIDQSIKHSSGLRQLTED